MAMRPRTTPTLRAQPSLRAVYENVQPKSEMKENKEECLLHIYLPGFTKERIRITYVGSTRMVRVAGERPIGSGNRWGRFDQTYPIPQNCEVEKLQGKFQQGILTITMPKKSISQVTPKAQVNETQEKGASPSQKAVAEPKPEEPIGDRKSASLTSPMKGPSDLKEQKGSQKDTPQGQSPKESQIPEDERGLRALTPLEPVREPRPQKVQEETVQKATIVTSATQKEQKGKPQNGQEEIETKTTLTGASKKKTDEKAQTVQEGKQIDEKHQEEIRQKTILATVKKQLDVKSVGKRGEDAEKERITKKEVKEENENPSESRKPEKDMEKGIFKEKEIRARKEESPKAAQPSASKPPEKEKKTSRRTSPSEETKSKEDLIDTIGKGIRELAASASQVVRRIAEGNLNKEDKPLVANMGAAVLVIAALGAYVSYKFASSGRT